MPQSQEKTPEQTELPNPELNPLLNPTLGRHLGRWAQVYFTSPPEKREEAVEELLRELQGDPSVTQVESANVPVVEAPSPSARPLEAIRIVEAVADPSSLKCDECGHPYTAPQRFCGMCGATLAEEFAASAEPIPRGYPERTVEPVFTHTDLPSLSPLSESVNPPDDGYSDIRWLRDKSLSDSGSGWGRARYAPAIIAVLAIGILFYAQSRPSKAPGQPAAKTVQTGPESAKPSAPPPAASAAEHGPAGGAAEPIASAPGGGTHYGPDQTTPSVLPPSSALPPSKAAAPADEPKPPTDGQGPARSTEPTAALNPASGAAELAMAEDFLNGKTHPRNSEEAAKYLWRAVGKENPTAILLLSDMYQVGDGVPKSCDQARLLLSAAARKGVPQAADKLRGLLRSGCPK